jgi:type II secretory pathway pseudopilin PulG
MKLGSTQFCRSSYRCAGFTLAETVVAIGAFGLVCAGLYAGISDAFSTVQVAREDLRATQIAAQTLEVIRLCSWSQSNPNTSFIPSSYSVPYDASGSVTGGMNYEVSVTITNAPGITAFYSNDLRMVLINVKWTSGKVQRTRTMSTYVSQYGLQNYVWNPQ